VGVIRLLTDLADQRRAIGVRIGARSGGSGSRDGRPLRDALGTALPVGLPDAFVERWPIHWATY